MKAFIDPRSTINYSSFYIQGLYNVLGKKNVRFSSKYFGELKEIDMLLAFVVVDNTTIKKIIIDYRDQSDIIEDAYQWSDVYAKINFNTLTTPNYANKILNIPPSFAIKIWNPLELLFYLCTNFFRAKIINHSKDKNIHLRPKRWIRNYLSLLKRQTLQNYRSPNEQKEDNYVFFASTFWRDSSNVDLYRSQYVLSCVQNQKINFEGGFFVNNGASVPAAIPKKLLYYNFISNATYQGKIKKSIFVFNTPAVLNCHGWKLGEFLCMGKAIISTPLINDLPVPLEHGKNIYIIQDKEEVNQAVELLLNDKELRDTLANNAKAYYEKYATPDKVIENIICHENTTSK
ncbi:MAG: hypothetical protein EZS26_001438 [Candidatus Ordinivivax streblomastigis]|uniref:Glycosyltransferase n=1 Tax=Candidatus Ordinivivax streblomastigis TaxID=2540710 RepID=A0A5M8P1L7_9BACT|nr:MAG: hypothetical protein EZS26_001438 [Candidatus Ordinivivax streblomastigis]